MDIVLVNTTLTMIYKWKPIPFQWGAILRRLWTFHVSVTFPPEIWHPSGLEQWICSCYLVIL